MKTNEIWNIYNNIYIYTYIEYLHYYYHYTTTSNGIRIYSNVDNNLVYNSSEPKMIPIGIILGLLELCNVRVNVIV